MDLFSQANLTLEFEIGRINGQAMNLVIADKPVDLGDQNNITYETNISFPSTLKIVVSGKTKTDTIVDAAGNIIKDKFIKLNRMLIDGFPIDRYYCQRFITLVPDNANPVTSNYWGFNGTITIDFQGNSFIWLAKTHKP